jgi:hypothetical protein
MKLHEEPTKGRLHADGDAPLEVHLEDGEKVHKAMHPNQGADTGDQIKGRRNGEHKCFSLTQNLIDVKQ